MSRSARSIRSRGRRFRREFSRIRRELGKTVVLVTHDMGEAFALATRIGVLDDGDARDCDTPGCGRASTDPRVRRFLEPLVDGTQCFCVNGRDERLLQFWRPTRPSSRCSRAALCSSRVSTAAATALGVPARHPGGRRPRHRRARSSGSPTSCRRFRASRCSGSCCRCRSSAASAPRTALVVLTLYALLPIIRTTAAGLRVSIARCSRPAWRWA